MASAPSFITLVAGRFVYGFGIGMAVHGGPLYIAETCPTNIRGMLVSMKEGGIVLGMLLGYVCGYLAMDVVGGWRIMYSIGGPIACIMCLGMCWLPRSPRWILLHAYKGNASVETSYEDAKVVIQRLLGKDAREDDVYCQLEDIVRSLEYFGNEITIREVFKGPSLRALIVGIGLVLFQQFTGQPSVLYYSTEIVQTAGFAETSDAAKVSIVIGVFKLIMTLLAVWRVDKIGRRPLLIGGIGILTCSLFVLAAYYAFIPQTSAVALIALFLYVGAYQVSFGPMGWLLLAEIFPLRTRAWASSFCLLINFSANAIVTFIFPILQVKIGTAAMFTIFGVIGAVGILFVALRLPETKGLSLEEIEAKFSD
ncbi:hypothetical protein KP509_11G036400 [Ceratopteris richardii]|nr:hypothetical protein KP509_11G036400 [Ceratopteris richardii]